MFRIDTQAVASYVAASAIAIVSSALLVAAVAVPSVSTIAGMVA